MVYSLSRFLYSTIGILYFQFLYLNLQGQEIAVIENEFLRIEFSLKNGLYQIQNKASGILCADSIYYQLNDWRSTDSSFQHTYIIQNPSSGKYPGGQTLQVYSNSGTVKMNLNITLLPGKEFVILACGILNPGNDTIHLRTIQPFSRGKLFPEMEKKNNFHILDGFGGGEPTTLKETLPVYSRNNLMIHFGNINDYQSLSAGGLTYHDFEKFAEVEGSETRRIQIQNQLPEGNQLLAYLDLGFNHQDGVKPMLRQGTGEPYRFLLPWEEARTIIYGWNFLLIEALELDTSKNYSAGISWIDDGNSRIQSVFVDSANNPLPPEMTHFTALSASFNPASYGLSEVINRQDLPSQSNYENPVMFHFNIPRSAYKNGNARILIKYNQGWNAVASEIWLNEGIIPENLCGSPIPCQFKIPSPSEARLNLYAFDPVGKRVDPGTAYQPDDEFYLDPVTRDPFESAEKYGLNVKKYQNINLSYYTFPTLCLWYLNHASYGNAGTGTTSIYAVSEMEKIKKSSFLKYSNAAIRMVPGYHGWWDDAHWQLYDYVTPFETSKKWAGGVISRGGIPLTYFSTGYRSEDYAAIYPDHMLFNKKDAYVPCFDFMVNAKSGYDYTDSGFVDRLRTKVYLPLRDAGIKGAMWDFPYTGWPMFGGMEDKYSTTAAAYRNIFKIAYEGFGQGSFLHERNLDRGADLTTGYVSSQRTWGDTDILTAEMVSRSGLRWYKNRVLYCYDMDAKNLLKAKPANPDGVRKILTMSYVAGSRLLLANSFSQLNTSILQDLSRVFPFPETPQSARPLDMFENNYPRVYDFKISDNWHQLCFYNTNDQVALKIRVPLSAISALGGMGLAADESYYIYDFWNNNFLGIFSGDTIFEQNVRAGEARMMSVHKVEANPQVISCNRHLMQGYMELSDILWDNSNYRLTGKALLPVNDTVKIIIATNGSIPLNDTADMAYSSISQVSPELICLNLCSSVTGQFNWSISFLNPNSKNSDSYSSSYTAYIYPNPVKNFFTLFCNEELSNPTMNLLDSHGSIRRTFSSKPINPAGGYQFDISGLPPGFYIFSVRSKNKHLRLPVLIN